MENLTLLVKTFERPGALRRELDSIRAYYPGVPVIVADDSRQPTPQVAEEAGVTAQYLQLPFDTGMSAGRNLMVQAATTEFVAMLDDDFIFGPESDLGLLRQELEAGGYDIVTGRLICDGGEQHYEGLMHQEAEWLQLYRPATVGATIPVHIGLNFFVARTAALRAVRWDPRLKICEHEDYFWRAKGEGLRVGYCPRVTAVHERERNPLYNEFRNSRVRQFRAMALEKHGWRDTVWLAI